MTQVDFHPPSLHEGLLAVVVVAAAAAVVAFAIRGALRDPLVPRWLSIFIVISASNMGLLIVREMISQHEYHHGLREGSWVFAWVGVYTLVFCSVAVIGHHVLPVSRPPIDDVAPKVGAEPASESSSHEPRHSESDRRVAANSFLSGGHGSK